MAGRSRGYAVNSNDGNNGSDLNSIPFSDIELNDRITKIREQVARMRKKIEFEVQNGENNNNNNHVNGSNNINNRSKSGDKTLRSRSVAGRFSLRTVDIAETLEPETKEGQSITILPSNNNKKDFVGKKGYGTLGRNNTISFGGSVSGKHQVIGTLSRKFATKTLKDAFIKPDEEYPTNSDLTNILGESINTGRASNQQKIHEIVKENLELSKIVKEYETTMELMISRVREQLYQNEIDKNSQIKEIENKVEKEMKINLHLREQNTILQNELARAINTIKTALHTDDGRDDELVRIRTENQVLRKLLSTPP